MSGKDKGDKRSRKQRDTDAESRLWRLVHEVKKTPKKGKGKQPPKGGDQR